jgi:hypothetical protein
MLTLLLAAACSAPVIELRTTHPWTKRDQAALTRAAVACGYYYPASPCLRRFIRVVPGQYRAVCGKAS